MQYGSTRNSEPLAFDGRDHVGANFALFVGDGRRSDGDIFGLSTVDAVNGLADGADAVVAGHSGDGERFLSGSI